MNSFQHDIHIISGTLKKSFTSGTYSLFSIIKLINFALVLILNFNG